MKPRWRTIVRIAGMLLALGVAFILGYQAGLKDKGPQHRALVVVRRAPGQPNSSGQSCTWYDISKPWDAMKLKADEKRLTDLGVEHYVAEGVMEYTLNPKPDPRRVNLHL